MSTKIKKVTAKFIAEDEIQIKIKTSKKSEDIRVTSKITQASNKIRFTINNPEINERILYEGIVEDKKLYLYPQYGEGVLTDKQPIIIK